MSNSGFPVAAGTLLFIVGFSQQALAQQDAERTAAPQSTADVNAAVPPAPSAATPSTGAPATPTALAAPSSPVTASPMAQRFAAEPEPARDEARRPRHESPSALHRIGIFISPGGLLVGMLPFELDVRVASPLTLNVQAVYVSSGSVSGYALAGGPQLFFSEHAFRGGYLFPVLAYASVSGAGVEATAVGGGATLGYQWLLGNFGLRLGGGFMYYSASAHGGTASASLSGASPAIDAAIGLSF